MLVCSQAPDQELLEMLRDAEPGALIQVPHFAALSFLTEPSADVFELRHGDAPPGWTHEDEDGYAHYLREFFGL